VIRGSPPPSPWVGSAWRPVPGWALREGAWSCQTPALGGTRASLCTASPALPDAVCPAADAGREGGPGRRGSGRLGAVHRRGEHQRHDAHRGPEQDPRLRRQALPHPEQVGFVGSWCGRSRARALCPVPPPGITHLAASLLLARSLADPGWVQGLCLAG